MTGRPPAEVPRPKHVAIRDNIVQCRHRNCHHMQGPYPSRNDTALAALDHWADRHARRPLAPPHGDHRAQ